MLDPTTIATLIPADEIAAAIQLAFRTLVAILSDKKAPVRERRAAATTILRLTSRERKLTVNQPSTPPPPDQPQTPPSPLCFDKGEGRGEGSEPSSSTPPQNPPPPFIPLNHARRPTHGTTRRGEAPWRVVAPGLARSAPSPLSKHNGEGGQRP